MPLINLINQVDELLSAQDDKKLQQLLNRQEFHAIGDVIERLPGGKRRMFALLHPELQAQVILVLSERNRIAVLQRLSDEGIARFLHFTDEDDAADILHFVTKDRRERIVKLLKEDKRAKVEKLLKFGHETAGGLMDLNFIVVKPEFTVKEVDEKIQRHLQARKHAPLVVVTDPQKRTIGFVPYRSLILTAPATAVGSLIHHLPLISYKMDQEKVLKIAMRERSDVLGVVDDESEILGIIHLRDLLRIAQKEATEDVYRFAGVSKEEEILDPPIVAVQMRYMWLIINLGTAFLAAFVVSLFEDTIQKTAILAAYMPIVAGMGGNAATQTLAVVVRGLAVHGSSLKKHHFRIVMKELTAGFINGCINGIIAAAVVMFMTGNSVIAFILFVAMVINLIVAGVFGSLITLSLKWMNIDPAIASTVFVTTCTDVFGFFTFLGLASLIIG